MTSPERLDPLSFSGCFACLDSDVPAGMTLTAWRALLVEAIAQRVADLLRDDLCRTPRLLTPTQVADRFAVSRTWVYEHADELGVIRLGQGPKARLRFDAETVSLVLRLNEPVSSEAPEASAAANSKKPAGGQPLLPIYGALGGQ